MKQNKLPSKFPKIIASYIPAFALSFLFAKTTAIGPVVLVISDKHGWGVHSGDLICLSSLVAVTTIVIIIINNKNQST